MTAKAALALVSVLTVDLGSPCRVPRAAQVEIGGFRLEGEVEAGWRFLVDEPAKSRRAKWEEYRDFPAGPFLSRPRASHLPPRRELLGRDGGQQVGADRPGVLPPRGAARAVGVRVRLGPDSPRLLDRRPLPRHEVSRGVYALPTPRPPLEAHNSAPTLDEIAQQWDQARMFFRLTPTPELELKAEYTRIRKSGDRPSSMAFGSPGNNFYQILEPIEQTVHDFRIGGTWAKDNWQLSSGTCCRSSATT